MSSTLGGADTERSLLDSGDPMGRHATPSKAALTSREGGSKGRAPKARGPGPGAMERRKYALRLGLDGGIRARPRAAPGGKGPSPIAARVYGRPGGGSRPF